MLIDTTTSADGKTITITRDANGDGLTDQSETRVTAADGSNTVTVSDLNPDGLLVDKTISTTSADGRCSVRSRKSAARYLMCTAICIVQWQKHNHTTHCNFGWTVPCV